MKNTNVIKLYEGLQHNLANLIGPQPFSAAQNLRLERITHLLALLGNPHHDFSSIHVGGTSGKGSTAAMIASILTEAGYKTGLHLSPHLQIINERHQINAHVSSTTQLADLYAKMEPAIARVAAESPFGPPSYFEAHVALAFLLFQQEAVDVAVVEVGLGGSLDATNVLNAAVAVLTNVGLDHTAILGHTVEAIAQDKAGIIKPGQTVVSGVLHPNGRQIVAERCLRQQATLWQLDQAFHYTLPNGKGFGLSMPAQRYDDLYLGLKGDFQIANAACAVAAVQALPGVAISEAVIRQGLLQAQIPGRVEVVQSEPVVVLDGAHNPEKTQAARAAIDKYYGEKRRVVVLSLKSDKAVEEILPHVVTGADLLIVTEFQVDKSMWSAVDANQLAQSAAVLAPNLDIRVVAEPRQAFAEALRQAAPDDLIWVTGSFYLVGNVRELWYPSHDLIAQAEKGLSGALAL